MCVCVCSLAGLALSHSEPSVCVCAGIGGVLSHSEFCVCLCVLLETVD